MKILSLFIQSRKVGKKYQFAKFQVKNPKLP